MDVTLRVWRQPGPNASGSFKTYEAKGISAFKFRPNSSMVYS